MSVFHRRLAALPLSLLAACGGGGGDVVGITHVQPPANLAYPADPAIYVVDIAALPNVPSFSGTVDHFSIDPPLPPGLTLDPASGAISGTPAATEPHTVHTVRAENAGGAMQVPLRISVVAPARFAYSISDDSTLSIFSADPVTGRLQRKGYVPAAAGETGPEAIVVHPSSRFAYVPNSTSSNISLYAIDLATGWVTRAAPVATGVGPHQMVIDAAGRFAYASCRGADQIRVYSIHAQTGALTPLGAPVATGTQPSALALDANGEHLFVTLRGNAATGAGSALSVFAVNPQSGALTAAGAPLALGTSKPVGVAVDCEQSDVYVIGEATSGLIAVHFDPATGVLSAQDTEELGSPPTAVAGHPTGKFAYAADFTPGAQAGGISIFQVAEEGAGLLAAGSETTGRRPSCLTLDPSGRFAYVTGHDSSDISAYAIDAETGALSLIDNILTRIGPTDFAIVQGPHVQAWTPRFVHVANSGSNDVSAFKVDAANGALTEVGTPTLAGTRPVSLATDPRQRFIYVANQDSSDIDLFLVSPSTGALFQVTPETPVFGHPTHITVDPSGRFLYLTVEGQQNPNSGWITTFSIHPTLGTLAEIDTQPLLAHPTWVTTDPTGQYLYVANSGTGTPGTGTVASFRLPLATGIPVSVESSAAPGVNGLGFHPSGKYMYAMLKHSNAMIEFTIDVSNGTLTLFPNVARAGLEPSSVCVTPDGRFAYVAFTNSLAIGHTALLPIDPSTGFLITPASPAQDGLHPIDLAVDPSGRFLYVANSGSNDVSRMSIDSTSGLLTVETPKACGLAPSAILVTGVTQ